MTAVTGAFTATGQSATYTPAVLLRDGMFNVTLYGTFVASVQLERTFDNGSNWHAMTAAGTPIYVWTDEASEQAQETEPGVRYRLNCTAYTSGTVTYRISE